MKFILIALFLLCSMNLSAQTDSSEFSKKLPPLEMLPKDSGEVKIFYELPAETIYQVYNQTGEEVLDGIGEFIDMTKLPKGVYFIKFDGQTAMFEKTTDPPKEKVQKPNKVTNPSDK